MVVHARSFALSVQNKTTVVQNDAVEGIEKL
jgi:hypothetical protein